MALRSLTLVALLSLTFGVSLGACSAPSTLTADQQRALAESRGITIKSDAELARIDSLRANDAAAYAALLEAERVERAQSGAASEEELELLRQIEKNTATTAVATGITAALQIVGVVLLVVSLL